MKVKCVGACFIKTKKDNTPMIMLHTHYPMRKSEDGTRLGDETKVFFVNLNDSESIFGCNATQLSLDLFVDHELDISCDFNGRPSSIEVV